jgi:hypothetical protein
VCANKRRLRSGHDLNLLHTERGRVIWIAHRKMPRDVEGAKDLAKTWARGILAFFRHGTPFSFDRDNDY